MLRDAAQLRWQRCSAGTAGDDDLAVAGSVLAGSLAVGVLAHAVDDVVVELVHRDEAVLVAVGPATAQALDEEAGEQRARLGGVEVGDAVGRRFLVGVLELGRRGERDATVALKAVAYVQRRPPPAFATPPRPNAPMWQQSRMKTIVRARLCCITSITKPSSTPLARRRSRRVVAVAKKSAASATARRGRRCTTAADRRAARRRRSPRSRP